MGLYFGVVICVCKGLKCNKTHTSGDSLTPNLAMDSFDITSQIN